MSNPIKNEFDKTSLIKDIAAATAVNLGVSSTPFSQSTNDQRVQTTSMF